MTIRTTTNTVTFARPFVLGDFDEVQPAGEYRVETDEELLEGISFPAYRRVLSLIHLHASPDHPGRAQMLSINPNDLDAALMRDRAETAPSADPEAGVPADAGPQGGERTATSPARAGLEPDLDEMMADPIVQQVLRSDGLSHDAAWLAIATARAQMSAGLGAENRLSATEMRQADADRQSMPRGADEAPMVPRA